MKKKALLSRRLIFSTVSKILISLALSVAVISFCWDLYKYIILSAVELERIIIDVFTIIGIYAILYRPIVKESPAFQNFLRTKLGFVFSWIFIIAYVMYSTEFLVGIIVSIFLLSFLFLHYTINFLKKRKDKINRKQ